jgi:hypothetical protein
MTNVAADLADSLVAAFVPHVEKRLRELRLERPDTMAGALEEGVMWLRTALEELLTLPFDEQRRGPLELFQEAMRFPTKALASAGVGAIARDPGEVAALPGDIYHLAPASSRLLGEEVWMTHLAWGAAKARSVGEARLIGLLSANLMDRARIEPLVAASGSDLVVSDGYPKGFGKERPPDLVLADLALGDAAVAIEELSGAGIRVVAYGPHIDRTVLRRARQAGADQVLARSAFFAKLGDLLI